MINKNRILVVLMLAATSFNAVPVYADAISPKIKEKAGGYSKEPARVEYYGTGVGGRAMEAMTLRFEVERLLQDGVIEEAVTKAKKACQLDPTDPTCHVLLARALTKKFYGKEGAVDEKLLAETLYEWKLIWFHSSDQWEQSEAKMEARKLIRIAKVLAKRRDQEAKARLAAKEALAKQKQLAAKAGEATPAAKAGEATSAAPVKPTEGKEAATPQAKETAKTLAKEAAKPVPEEEAIPIAEKKKRFFLF